jgi:hypothetical protein
MKNGCNILVGKSYHFRDLSSDKNIKMDFKELQCEGVDWIQLDQDRNRSKLLWIWQWTFRVHKRHFLISSDF